MIVVSALARVTDALLQPRDAGPPMADGQSSRRDHLDAAGSPRTQSPASIPGAGAALDAISRGRRALRAGAGRVRRRLANPPELDAVAAGRALELAADRGGARGAGLDAGWVDVRPVMVTDDRFTRATPLHPGAERPGPRGLAPLLDAGADPGDAGIHRRHRDGCPHDPRPGRIRFHRLAARRGARRRAEWRSGPTWTGS